MAEGKRNIIRQLLKEYDIQTAEDIQEALKDIFILCPDGLTGIREAIAAAFPRTEQQRDNLLSFIFP